ncbi:MAG: hypothetical protein AAGU11_11225 [Syntrophobacteraceae bacterium]
MTILLKRVTATLWELPLLTAIFPSEFCYSPISEHSCSTVSLTPGSLNIRLIKEGKAEHGEDWPRVDFLPIERPMRARSFLNETGIHQNPGLSLPEYPVEEAVMLYL